jgi:superfamily II DNA or RNA helicase
VLREEQIDIRRKRAAEEQFQIEKLGKGRVFGEYKVTNPRSRGEYQVDIRGFEVGDNSCTCPDFRTNTLGTCKHIEAVLASLREETPVQLQHRKATISRPEVYLSYGEQLQVGLHLPARHSDALARLAATFFDDRGLWKGAGRFDDLLVSLEQVPEQVTLFSDARDHMELAIEQREMLRREQESLALLERGELKHDDLLTVPLYPYQVRGVLFAAYRGRVIIGDDMGLGKTIQALAAAELMARERGVERVLVVSPASVKYQWLTECQKFSGRPAQVIDGTNEDRRERYAQSTFYRLINYELVLRDLDLLNAWKPDLIVLDEAQRIKNWESKLSRAVKKLRSPFAIVLTGTPLENKLEELYSIVTFVDDRQLGPAFQFLHDHRMLDEEGKLLGYRNLDRVREKLQPIFLRRTRQEVLTQLPARTDSTVYVEMTDAQRAPYGEQQTTLARLLQKPYLTEVDRRRILCCIANMRMLCDSTFLYDHQTNVSPKLEEFADRIHELVLEETHKLVVFSQWEVMVRKAAEVLDSMQVGYVLLHGGVPGKDRKELMDRFREDPACRVFLSTDAGGTGLNLQSADTVINLEPPWNPAVLEQRIARVHRLGQHRPVQVINLVTRDSIEERVLKTIDLKRSLFEGVFTGGTDEVSFASLGQRGFLEVVRDLVSPEEKKPATPVPAGPVVDPMHTLIQAGLQFLEALAAVMSSGNGTKSAGAAQTSGVPAAGLPSMIGTDARTGQPVLQLPLPSPEVMQRGGAALQAIVKGLQGKKE